MREFPMKREAVRVMRPGMGETRMVLGHSVTFKATTCDTEGAYSLLETVVPPGNGTPPHSHSGIAEGFYVRSGALEIVCDRRIYLCRAGDFIFAPRGMAHGYFNPHGKEARLLTFCAPGGIERLCRDITALPQNGAMGEIAPLLAEAMARHGIQSVPDAETIALMASRRQPVEPPTRRERDGANDLICLTDREATGGEFALWLLTSPPEGGGALRTNPEAVEGFYVLEGAFDVRAGERAETLEAGAFVHLPKGVPRAYQNALSSESRALVFTAPDTPKPFDE